MREEKKKNKEIKLTRTDWMFAVTLCRTDNAKQRNQTKNIFFDKHANTRHRGSSFRYRSRFIKYYGFHLKKEEGDKISFSHLILNKLFFKMQKKKINLYLVSVF